MAVRPILQYRNADSTLDLNSTKARIVDRAIFDGGSLTPSGVSLQVTVAPFIAAGYDGMVAISDASEVLSVPAPAVAGPNRISYLILHLEYRTLTSPIVNLQVVPETTWLTSVSRNFFVTFARFEVPFGATSLTDPGVVVDYSVGDWADKLGKTGWRSPVANSAALPLTGNRSGDARITLDTNTVYVWDSTAGSWTVAGGALDLSEVVTRSDALSTQKSRVTDGTGLVSSLVTDPLGRFLLGGSSLTSFGVPWSAVNSPNQLIMEPSHWVLNGRFLKTRSRTLTLSAPPVGASPRYDLVYLQVWRQLLAVPSSSVTYDNQAGTPTSFSAVSAALEQLLETYPSPNYDFLGIEYVDSTTLAVTTYQYSVASGVPSSSLSSLSSLDGLFTSVDATPFTLSHPSDKRVFVASTADPQKIDGVILAIPVLVVKRPGTTSPDPETIGAYITQFRPLSSNRRFVWDVAPRSDSGIGLTALSTFASSETGRRDGDREEMAAGWLSGTETPIVSSGVANEIVVPKGIITIDGYKISINSQNVLLPAPPASQSRRDIVVLELVKLPVESQPNSFSSVARELYGTDIVRTPNKGPSLASYSIRTVVFSSPLASTSYTDEDDSMSSLGALTHPLLGSGWGGYSKNDPGLWFRAGGDEEGGSVVYAMPIAIVSRRNTNAYSNTNQSGGASLPAGFPSFSATLPWSEEIVDLRRRSVITDSDLEDVLDQSYESLLQGELKTQGRNHPFSPSPNIPFGYSHILIDHVSNSSLSGARTLNNGPDGHTAVWSESRELFLMSWSFDDTSVVQNDGSVSYDGINPCFSWNGGGSGGTLTVRAPSGCHFSFGEGVDLTNDPLAPNNIQVAFSNISTGAITAASPFSPAGLVLGPGGELISFTSTISHSTVAANTRLYIHVWVHKEPRNSSDYPGNEGLTAVPKEVYHVTDGTTSYNVGPIKVALTIPIVGLTATITQADVLAAYAALGKGPLSVDPSKVNLYGIENISIPGFAANSNIRYVELDDGAGVPGFARMIITFEAAVAGTPTCDVVVFCEGDQVYKWVEFAPNSKQIRGPYQWSSTLVNNTSTIQRGTRPSYAFSAPPYTSHLVPFYDIDVGSALFATAAGPSSGVSSFSVFSGLDSADLIFYVSTGAGPWRVWRNPADNPFPGVSYTPQEITAISPRNQGTAWHSFVSYGQSSVVNSYAAVVAPVQVPLSSSDSLRIFYRTPVYQGDSTSSGLKDRSLGVVEAVGDLFVSSFGPGASWISPRTLPATRVARPSNVNRSSYVPHQLSVDIGFRGALGTNNFLRGPKASGRVRSDNLSYVRIGNSSYFEALSYLPSVDALGFDSYILCQGTSLSKAAPPVLREFITATDLISSAFPTAGGWVYISSIINQSIEAVNIGDYVSAVLRLSQNGFRLVDVNMPEASGSGLGGLAQLLQTNLSTGAVSTIGSGTAFTSPQEYKRLGDLQAGSSAVFSPDTQRQILVGVIGAKAEIYGGIEVRYWPPNPERVASSPFLFFSESDLRSYQNEILTNYPYTPLSRGVRLEDVWGVDFSSVESSLVSPGTSDYAGMPQRGVGFVGSPASLVPNQTGYSLLISPISSILGTSPSLTPYGRELPRNHSPQVTVFGYNDESPDYSMILGACRSYLVRSEAAGRTDEVSMVVDTGIGSRSSNRFTVSMGSATDVFYPVGRPVFRRKV